MTARIEYQQPCDERGDEHQAWDVFCEACGMDFGRFDTEGAAETCRDNHNSTTHVVNDRRIVVRLPLSVFQAAMEEARRQEHPADRNLSHVVRMALAKQLGIDLTREDQ